MAKIQIVIDTREQRPWHFPDGEVDVRRGTIGAGDYCLEGDGEFAIERKSLPDFVGTVCVEWERFQRELMRMSGVPARVVIVEGSVGQIMNGDYTHPGIKPGFVMKRVAELTLMGVCVLFCENNVMAAAMAWRIFWNRRRMLDELAGENRKGAVPEAG